LLEITARKQAVALSIKMLSKLLKVPKSQILLSSTGIIGRPFPVKKIEKAIPELVENLSTDGGPLEQQSLIPRKSAIVLLTHSWRPV